jgi:outer membrane protein OmpA-like peptidoglycan-associated protein
MRLTTKVFKFLLLLLFSLNAIGQKQLYPLTIIAKDERAGSQFNATYVVKSTKSNEQAKVEYKEGFAVAYLNTGEKYKIDATAEGYAPKSETITIELDADPKDGRTKNITMKPTMSAHVMVKAIDDKTEEAIPADFKLVIASSKKTLEASTNKDVLEKRVIVGTEQPVTAEQTPKEELEISASANNYELATEKLVVEIKDPAQKYPIVLRLKKANFPIKIRVVDSRDLPIKKTKIIVREVGSVNPTISQLDPPNSEVTTTLKPEKTYRLNIEAPGYNTYEKTFTGQEAVPDWSIRLTPKFEAFYKVKAFDKGKRIPVNIKVSSSKQGVISEIPETDTTSNIKVTDYGIYKLEVNAKGYQPVIEDIFVEGTEAGKLQIRNIALERGLKEFVIRLIDETSNVPLMFGEVKVKTSAGVLVKATKNIQTNDWTVALEDGGQYVVEASSPDYKATKESVKMGATKFIDIKMAKLLSSINLAAIDRYTKKPITAQFKVIRSEATPIEGSVKADGSRFKIDMLPGQSNKVEVKSDGYQTILDEIAINSNGKGDTKIFELTKSSYPFQLKIIDAETNKIVQNARLKTLDVDGKELKLPINTKGLEFEVDLKVEEKYKFEVQADGYDKKEVTFDPSESTTQGFKKEIFISKKPLDIIEISFVDEETKEVLKSVEVKVTSGSKPIDLAKSSTNGAVNLTWNEKTTYEIEAKQQDYETIKQELRRTAGLLKITLLMKKLQKKELVVNAIDLFTKKPVEVTFKWSSDLSPATTVEGSTFKTQYAKERTFSIEATADGYEKQKLNIVTNNINAEPYELKMQKEKYPFEFKAIDMTSKEVLSQSKVIVKNITQSGDKIKNVESVAGKINVDLKPAFTYEVMAEAKGYDAAKIIVDIAMFVGGKYAIDVPMSLKKEPVPAVVKREEPAPKPVEKPKETPQVVEKPKEVPKSVEKPKEIPKPKKTEEFTELAVGKVMMLDNVFFDQGSYELREESKPQLEKLLTALKSNPKLKIEVIGHTSNEGDPRINLGLSKFRAKVIANYLFNKGITEDRISSTGFGSEKPLAKDGSEDELKKNRRVEVVVKEF